jgi:mono/diheme cytochrome c family protein
MALALLTTGCRQDMHDQPVAEPFEASEFFADGVANRQFPDGTVARGQLRDDTVFYTGLTPDDTMATDFPLPVDRDLLLRGRGRFDTFCAPCHDRTGSGLGMIVRRGFKQPASFHDERLRQQPVGYFYGVISNGFGDMSSYASQIRPEDRWAVVAYLRTLQWSQKVSLDSLPTDVRAQIESELAGTRAAEPVASHGEE